MDAWWNSAEIISKFNDLVKIALILLIGLTLIGSILTFVLSKRLSTLQGQETKALQDKVVAAEKHRAEERQARAIEEQREQQRRHTPPQLDAYLAFGENSRELLVVIDAKNDIPFKYQWIVVTENDKVVSGIPLEYQELHPTTSKDKRWNHRARIQRDKVINNYVELRFSYESIYLAELGYPPELRGKIIQKYKLVGDIPHPLE